MVYLWHAHCFAVEGVKLYSYIKWRDLLIRAHLSVFLSCPPGIVVVPEKHTILLLR